MEVNRKPSRESYVHNEKTGDKILMIDHGEERIVEEWGLPPGETMCELRRRLDTGGDKFHPAILEFDPRDPSRLHDTLERAKRDPDYSELAELAEANLKVKERPGRYRGRFPLGACWCVRGLPGQPDGATLRRFVREHVTQEPVELDETSRWCPPLACPNAENQMAIETNHGLVRSKFSFDVEETQGAIFPIPTGRTVTHHIHVWTLLASDPGKITTFIH
jgi:hypothetical protein